MDIFNAEHTEGCVTCRGMLFCAVPGGHGGKPVQNAGRRRVRSCSWAPLNAGRRLQYWCWNDMDY
eukprot:500442-Pyramimonas_sp.AAC.1